MPVAIVDNGIKQATGGSSTTCTKSQALTAGANLLVIWTVNHGANACTGVTYNGVSMTSLGEKTCNYFGNIKRVSMWYLENPATGSAYDIIATWGTSVFDKIIVGASFSGYGSFGTVYSNGTAVDGFSANPTLTISDRAAGDYAVGCVGIMGIANDPTEDQTLIAEQSVAANDDHWANAEYSTSTGSLSWTVGGSVWANIGAAIKPAAATGQPASRRMGGVKFAGNQSLGMNRW